jgi:hypothetical protein
MDRAAFVFHHYPYPVLFCVKVIPQKHNEREARRCRDILENLRKTIKGRTIPKAILIIEKYE